MNEVTVLKSSILGGYNKKDVERYIDSILEENSQNLKDLEQKLLFLTQENGSLKEQLEASDKRRTGSKEKALPASEKHRMYSSSAPLQAILKRDQYEDAQEMSLPEGTYILSKDHGMISLPSPRPIYQTREKAEFSESYGASDGNLPPILQEDNVKGRKEDTSFLPYTGKKLQTSANGLPGRNVSEDSKYAPEPSAFEEGPSVIMPDGGKVENKVSEMSGTSSMKEFPAEMERLKIELESEKTERRKLAAKLEYSTDLLLQLYKST